MTDRIKIPPCWESDNGGDYYVEGHVSPEMAVLSVLVTTMTMVGCQEAMQLLVGGPTTGAHGDGWLLSDQLGLADDVVNSATHVWLRPDPDDEEHMLNAADDVFAEGVSKWTRVNLSW